MDEWEREKAYRELQKFNAERKLNELDDYKPGKCVDCSDDFSKKSGYARSKTNPFLCETCAQYREGGY